MKKETLLCQIGRNPEKYFKNVNAPVCRTSTFIYENIDEFLHDDADFHTDITYARSNNVTQNELANAISLLLGATSTEITSSGLSSIMIALFTVLESGDHLLIPDTAYKCTKRFVEDHLPKLGISYDYYNAMDVNSIKLHPNTKCMFIEAPGSGTFEVPDLEKLYAIAAKHNLITVVDNTWATPLFCNPFELGADIVVMSLSKHISGHADVILGAISAKKAELADKIHKTYVNFAPNASPDDAYLALRGMRSLPQRLKHQQATSDALSQFLSQRSEIIELLNPSYPQSNSYANWSKYFTGTSGVLSFALKKNDLETAKKFISSLKIIKIGLSWGGYESLIVPYKLDALIDRGSRLKASLYLRLSCGLENSDDLIHDIESALKLL